MTNKIICPVDTATINEIKVRITAAFVILVAVTGLLIHSWIIPAFLVIDFFLRSGKGRKYSPLGFFSGQILKIFSLKGRQVNVAPKKFAARIGLVLSVLFLLAELVGFLNTSFAMSAILVFFAFLESAIGFCAGCYIYTFYRKLFTEKSGPAVLKQEHTPFSIE